MNRRAARALLLVESMKTTVLSGCGRRLSRLLVLGSLLAACTTDGPPAAAPGPTPGGPVVTRPTPAEQQTRDGLRAAVGTGPMTPVDFSARYAATLSSAPDYDPSAALGLATIQASPLALNAAELAALGRRGFVLSERQRYPTFTYGYSTLYMADLPLFVSADSILHAVHSSYNDILAAIELASLRPDLDAMLVGMRARLAAGDALPLGAEAGADADLYTAVALNLLRGEDVAPVAGADAGEIRALVAGAMAAEGRRQVRLFGTTREEDFSQFRPRGHYAEPLELARYFRATMWLGRTDLRILETQRDGSQVFHRRQLVGAYALRALMGDETMARWRRIERTVGAFVGEADNMTVDQLDPLLRDLGLTAPAGLAGVSDEAIAAAVRAGAYGTQRIASHIMINGTRDGFTLPLSSTFLLLGQRYVLDSHVLSNVVYDRAGGGSVRRMMPDPLDVAFAALGNDQAGALLADELQRYDYARDLHAMRVLADAHPADYWDANLYNRWMRALRTLSPREALAPASAAGLPGIARTEAWGRRLLNTQLASWAELRHDTLLYVKQSYTGGAVCEFPDAYVDPYPTFYGAIADLARRGEEVVGDLELPDSPQVARIRAYFPRLRDVAERLRGMAEHQRTGTPFTAEQMAFINQAVVLERGCVVQGSSGWFPQLYFDNASTVAFDPTIADVHTQPTDAAGNDVGRVLHVGTGNARLMVVTVDTCAGPRAYAGLASSYFERVTERYDRLDDMRWSRELNAATPADPPWLRDVITR